MLNRITSQENNYQDSKNILQVFLSISLGFLDKSYKYFPTKNYFYLYSRKA